MIIKNVSSMFIPLAYQNEKHERQYLAKGSVSSKYRVEPESKKGNVNDILNWVSIYSTSEKGGYNPGGNYAL